MASIAACDGMKDRTIICNGVSKAYAMTGWRLGWVAAPEWIVKGMNKLQGQYTSGTCDVSQMAALAAYQSDQQCVEEMRKGFERRRDLIVKPGQGDTRTEGQCATGCLLLVPAVRQFLWQTLWRYRHQVLYRFRLVPFARGACGHSGWRCFR